MFIVGHPQQHFGEKILLSQHDIHMFVQKSIRSHAEGVFQTNHVIWIQKKLQIAAATVKTRNIHMAAEPEGVAGFQPNAGQGFDVGLGYRFHLFHVKLSVFWIKALKKINYIFLLY
jgi:hypothetical protein